jgi:perosamine synthetase
VRKLNVPLFKIFWDDDDTAAVSRVIRRGMYWTCGPESKELEKKLAGYIGTRYAVVFNSGTSALHASLLAHKIKSGDEVIVPSFTFIATANAVLLASGKPVFADIETKTLGLDPNDVEKRITPKTKAIIPVHVGGSPCLIAELRQVAEDHKLLLIEDAAESIGARIGDEKVGTFGDSAMLSFCQNKVVTTGDGGAVVTDSPEVFERLKLIRSHGRLENSDYFTGREPLDYVTLGYNYRMSDITAALGLSQLAKIERLIKARREKAEYLNKRLSKVERLLTPKPCFDNYFHVYQMYTVRLPEGKKARDDLADYLGKKGVATKIYFSPVHLTHFYKKELKYKIRLPTTEKMSEQVLTLPLYPTLSEQEMNYAIDNVESFFSTGGWKK